MAKMFYTLEEAAEHLGMEADQIKQMASEGRLQQFRDRDKLMFKRDQIDSLAGSSGETSVGAETGTPQSDSRDTDAIDLKSDTTSPDQGGAEDTREATGVSVFDAGEVDQADPSAQTQVNQQQDEELALESVGSGSGLLDLTRESDDTSLGSELLDEIYPSGGESSDQKSESAAGSATGQYAAAQESGAGETAGGVSGLSNLGEPSPAEPEPAETSHEPAAGRPSTAVAAEPYDPAGSGLGIGLFIGATVTLILGLIVMVSAIGDVQSGLVQSMTAGPNSLVIWAVALTVGSAILGVVGLLIGRSLSS